jgi:RNA polymerase sigma factor (sigma-70 family)
MAGVGLMDRPEVTSRDEALAALFDRHYAPMCRLAYVILGDAALAEEIVMEALLKTFSGWSRIRNRDHIDAYVRRAVINMCRSRIRRKAIEARVNAAMHGREQRRAPDWDPERHETARIVWDAVRGLPERQRNALLLRHSGYRYREIAEALGMAAASVGALLARAERAFAAAYEERDHARLP